MPKKLIEVILRNDKCRPKRAGYGYSNILSNLGNYGAKCPKCLPIGAVVHAKGTKVRTQVHRERAYKSSYTGALKHTLTASYTKMLALGISKEPMPR